MHSYQFTQRAYDQAMGFRDIFDVYEVTRIPSNLRSGPGVVTASDWFIKEYQAVLIIKFDVLMTKFPDMIPNSPSHFEYLRRLLIAKNVINPCHKRDYHRLKNQILRFKYEAAISQQILTSI